MTQSTLDCSEVAPEEPKRPPTSRSVTQFEQLAISLIDSVYNLARWLVQSDHEAEDLVRETYLEAFESSRSFRVGTNFRARLFRILFDTFSSSRKRLPADFLVSLDSDDEGPDRAVEHKTPEAIFMKLVDPHLIQRALDGLPDTYRETILLCDVEKLSYCEISETLSIPIGTVMSQLSLGRKAIRNSLRSMPSVSSLANAPATTTSPM